MAIQKKKQRSLSRALRAPLSSSDDELSSSSSSSQPRISIGDVVVFHGVERHDVVTAGLAPSFGYIEKSWNPKDNVEIIATYAGEIRMSVLSIPSSVLPPKLHTFGLRRRAMMRVMMHTFMTQAGSIVIADPHQCEKIV